MPPPPEKATLFGKVPKEPENPPEIGTRRHKMYTKKIYFLNKNKEKLLGILHLPDKKTKKLVIVCHGFASNKNSLWIPKLCNTLAKKGYTALRFDFSGNGQSEGKFENSNCEKEKQDLQLL